MLRASRCPATVASLLLWVLATALRSPTGSPGSARARRALGRHGAAPTASGHDATRVGSGSWRCAHRGKCAGRSGVKTASPQDYLGIIGFRIRAAALARRPSLQRRPVASYKPAMLLALGRHGACRPYQGLPAGERAGRRALWVQEADGPPCAALVLPKAYCIIWYAGT